MQPSNLPSFPQQLPPVRAAPQTKETIEPSVSELQDQLADTTAKTTALFGKLHSLENQFSTSGIQELVAQVSALSEMIEERRHAELQHQQHVHDNEDDDNRSIHTITSHELESVPEEDESEAEESEEERSARREELGRPRTPEPTSLGMHDDYDSKDDGDRMTDPVHPPGIPDELTRRITILTDKLETCMELSQALQTRHAGTVQQIDDLHTKVKDLEGLIHTSETTRTEQAVEFAKMSDISVLLAQAQEAQEGRAQTMMQEFQKMLSEQAARQKEEQLAILEQLESNFVAQTKQLTDSTHTSIQSLESRLTSLALQFTTERAKQAGLGHLHNIGKSSRRKHGLVTPPSPTSLSDSELFNADLSKFHNFAVEHHGRERRRTQSASPSRHGRRKSSRSRSPATSTTSTTLVDSATGSIADGASIGAKPEHSFDTQAHSRSSSSDECSCRKTQLVDSLPSSDSPEKSKFNPRFPPTPAQSIHLEDMSGGRRAAAKARVAEQQIPVRIFIREAMCRSEILFMMLMQVVSNAQVAVGVIVLGIAAAAVLWRVKE